MDYRDIPDPGNADDVTMEKMALVFEDREPMTIDLTQSEEEIKNIAFHVKEGVAFQVQLTFRIKDRIVSGLRYFHVVRRKGIKTDKESLMVGSYGPKEESQIVTIDKEMETPKGMIARGHYRFHSKFTDDNKNPVKQWEWGMDITKDWE